MNVTPTQITGIILVISGLLMTGYQILNTSWNKPPMRGATFNRSGFQLKTTYPGIIVIGLGVFVLIVGTLVGR